MPASAPNYGDASGVACHGFKKANVIVRQNIVDGKGVGTGLSSTLCQLVGGYAVPEYGLVDSFSVTGIDHNLGAGVGVVGSITYGDGTSLEGLAATDRKHLLLGDNTLMSGQFGATGDGFTAIPDHKVILPKHSDPAAGTDLVRGSVVRELGYGDAARALASEGDSVLSHDWHRMKSPGQPDMLLVPAVGDASLGVPPGDPSIASTLFAEQVATAFDGKYADVAPIEMPSASGASPQYVVPISLEDGSDFIKQVKASLTPQDELHKRDGVAFALQTSNDPATGEPPSGYVDLHVTMERTPLATTLENDLISAGVSTEPHERTGNAAISNSDLSTAYGIGGTRSGPMSSSATQVDVLAESLGISATSLTVEPAGEIGGPAL